MLGYDAYSAEIEWVTSVQMRTMSNVNVGANEPPFFLHLVKGP